MILDQQFWTDSFPNMTLSEEERHKILEGFSSSNDFKASFLKVIPTHHLRGIDLLINKIENQLADSNCSVEHKDSLDSFLKEITQKVFENLGKGKQGAFLTILCSTDKPSAIKHALDFIIEYSQNFLEEMRPHFFYASDEYPSNFQYLMELVLNEKTDKTNTALRLKNIWINIIHPIQDDTPHIEQPTLAFFKKLLAKQKKSEIVLMFMESLINTEYQESFFSILMVSCQHKDKHSLHFITTTSTIFSEYLYPFFPNFSLSNEKSEEEQRWIQIYKCIEPYCLSYNNNEKFLIIQQQLQPKLDTSPFQNASSKEFIMLWKQIIAGKNISEKEKNNIIELHWNDFFKKYPDANPCDLAEHAQELNQNEFILYVDLLIPNLKLRYPAINFSEKFPHIIGAYFSRNIIGKEKPDDLLSYAQNKITSENDIQILVVWRLLNTVEALNWIKENYTIFSNTQKMKILSACVSLNEDTYFYSKNIPQEYKLANNKVLCWFLANILFQIKETELTTTNITLSQLQKLRKIKSDEGEKTFNMCLEYIESFYTVDKESIGSRINHNTYSTIRRINSRLPNEGMTALPTLPVDLDHLLNPPIDLESKVPQPPSTRTYIGNLIFSKPHVRREDNDASVYEMGLLSSKQSGKETSHGEETSHVEHYKPGSFST